jgi:hypothetical protein
MTATWIFKINPMLSGLCVAFLYSLLSGTTWSLIVAIWFFISAALIGKKIRGWLSDTNPEKNWLYNVLVGVGLLGTVTGLMAHFEINYTGLYGTMLAIPMILSWRTFVRVSQNIHTLVVIRSLNGIKLNALDISIAAVGSFYFIIALLPELGFDALAVHLFVPAQLALRHQWGFDVTNYCWAVMPLLGDWIFSIGYILGGESAARLLNVGFIFILGLLIHKIVIWASSSKIYARLSVLLFISTPLTFTVGSSLFIDSIWTTFIVAGVFTLLRLDTSDNDLTDALILSGIFLGYALASKSITIPNLMAVIVLLMWRFKTWASKRMLLTAITGFGLLVLLGSIPYTTAWWIAKNPVFPFFNAIFKSPYFPPVNFKAPDQFLSSLSWDFLYRVTFHSGNFLEAEAGASGFQWLLLLFPGSIGLLIAKNRKGIELIIISVLMIIAVFHFTSYLRYIFPAVVLLIAVIGIAFSKVFSNNRIIYHIALGSALLTVVLNMLFIYTGAAAYRNFKLNPLLSEANRKSFLKMHLPIRNAVDLVNQVNAGRTPVIVMGQMLVAGIEADVLIPNWYNHEFSKSIWSIKSEADAISIIKDKNVDYIIIDSNWILPHQRKYFQKVTEEIKSFGSVSVRTIKKEFRFNRELLINPDFFSIDGWQVNGNAIHDAINGIVTVNISSNVVQLTQVKSGHTYRNAIISRCNKEPGQGRIQVNWLDNDSKLISADAVLFECSDSWTEHSMEVIAPLKAAYAIIYTVGHTDISLQFKKNSFCK